MDTNSLNKVNAMMQYLGIPSHRLRPWVGTKWLVEVQRWQGTKIESTCIVFEPDNFIRPLAFFHQLKHMVRN